MTDTTVTPGELRAARLRAGLTQTQIAAPLGIDKTRVSRIEAGTMNPARLEDWQLDEWAGLIGIAPSRMPRPHAPGEHTILMRTRERRRMTCMDLARRIGVPARRLRPYDEGTRAMRNMSAGMLLDLADALDTSMERLCGMPDSKRTPPEPDIGWNGTRLAWYRHRAGLSQARLAIMSGRTPQQITGIETGRWDVTAVRAGTVIDLASALDVPARLLIDPRPADGQPSRSSRR